MSISNAESLASLKLLVAVAKADGDLGPDERVILGEAIGQANLAGTTPDALLGGTYDVETLIAEIRSDAARDAAFSACFAMAYADRACHPAEQAILDRLERAWTVKKERKGLLSRVFDEARDTVSLTRIEPIADPARRKAAIDEDVLKYSVISGVLGLNPIPLVSIPTDLAVVAIQAKMFVDVGQYWGRETTLDAAKQVIAGVGVGTGARIAVNNVLKFVPGVGSVVAATTNFASTWALGKVADQYWESGGKADMKMLRDLFKRRQAEGKKVYAQHEAKVAERERANRETLDRLAADLNAGRISQAQYQDALRNIR